MGNPLYDGASVGDLVVTAIARGGERTAFIGDHIQYSYRELGERISQVVQALKARGLRRGDAVATLSSNRPEAFLITAAAYLSLDRRARLPHRHGKSAFERTILRSSTASRTRWTSRSCRAVSGRRT